MGRVSKMMKMEASGTLLDEPENIRGDVMATLATDDHTDPPAKVQVALFANGDLAIELMALHAGDELIVEGYVTMSPKNVIRDEIVFGLCVSAILNFPEKERG
jgi:hypothetical protein